MSHESWPKPAQQFSFGAQWTCSLHHLPSLLLVSTKTSCKRPWSCEQGMKNSKGTSYVPCQIQTLNQQSQRFFWLSIGQQVWANNDALFKLFCSGVFFWRRHWLVLAESCPWTPVVRSVNNNYAQIMYFKWRLGQEITPFLLWKRKALPTNETSWSLWNSSNISHLMSDDSSQR